MYGPGAREQHRHIVGHHQTIRLLLGIGGQWDAFSALEHCWGALDCGTPSLHCLIAGELIWCGVVWRGVVSCGVAWRGVAWRRVVWCGVVWRGVAWYGVPKALLPKGNGWDGLACGKLQAGRTMCISACYV